MSSSFYQPSWIKQFSHSLTVAESTRMGGMSTAPYFSLNLGLHTADDPTVVAQNRALFCEALGWQANQLAGAYQRANHTE